MGMNPPSTELEKGISDMVSKIGIYSFHAFEPGEDTWH